MKSGDMVVQRIKLPAHALVSPHTHPFAETVTVISGTVGFGMGDRVDRNGRMLGPGGLYAHPAKNPHFVWTGDEGASRLRLSHDWQPVVAGVRDAP